jgi:hypothetical protein
MKDAYNECIKTKMNECMVCFGEMTWWNMHVMACSHSICIECTAKIQTMSDTTSDETESEDVEIYDGVHTMVPRELEPEFEWEEIPQAIPQDYTVKYSQEGIKVITRVNYFVLQGYNNSLQCPYCRRYEPTIYDFNQIRYYVPKRTLEWNILERKLYSGLSSFTMSKEGETFAFKLSKDETCLRIMWTEVNTYAFTMPQPHTKVYSDHKVIQKYKDSRTYNRSNRYVKMIR